MATTTDDVDYLGRPLYNTDTEAIDYMGRAVTTTVDFLGRDLLETEEEPEPDFLLEDDWTGTNGDPWDATKWASHTSTNNIQGNAGSQSGGEAIIFSIVTATDFELVVKGSWASLTGRFPEIGWRIGVATIGEAPADGYVIQMSSADGGKVTLHRLDPSYVSVGNAAATELHANISAWFRIRAEGDDHKVRWWLDGDTEPGTWQIEETDAVFTEGVFMFRTYSGGVTWDDLTVEEL